MLLASPHHVRPVFDGEESFPHRRPLAVAGSQLADQTIRKQQSGAMKNMSRSARLRHLTTIRLGALRRLSRMRPGPRHGVDRCGAYFVTPR